MEPVEAGGREEFCAEPVRERELQALDARELAATLRAGGPLQRLHPGYEQRPGQVAMLQAVCDAFNDEVIVAAEAGTGIGKSLAYLIPAVAWAAANDERVVVSTATINLQQQLLAQDLPLAQRVLGISRFVDFQKVRIQETQQELPRGSIPRRYTH